MTGSKSNDDSYTSAGRRKSGYSSAQDGVELGDQDFFGGISTGLAHDLQTLLTPITTCLQMVSSRPKEAAELLPVALRSLESVQDYVRQARWYAEHNSPQWKLALLDPVLVRAVAVLEDRIVAKSLKTRLEIEKEMLVEVDAVLMLRLLTNLLANAIDVAPEGSEIGLELSRSADTGRLRLAVNDQGKGIPEDMAEMFFLAEAGFRGDSARSGKPGLGWAICRRIVDLHGGKIKITRREQGGTAIVVELPFRQEKAA